VAVTPQAASDWLMRTPDFQRDTAAELGTQVHVMAEALGRGEIVPIGEALRPYFPPTGELRAGPIRWATAPRRAINRRWNAILRREPPLAPGTVTDARLPGSYGPSQ
jgi:hypothetical protein